MVNTAVITVLIDHSALFFGVKQSKRSCYAIRYKYTM